ncbi:MAG: PEP/pyruvate-binding domain-containing protein [Verrucomicrobiota bacterium]
MADPTPKQFVFAWHQDDPSSFPLGGKARALAILQEAGLPILPWFAVLPHAFETSKSAESSNEIPSSPSPEVMDEINAALKELEQKAGTRFAVRSSAIDEDGAEHSFAGQLESYLFVADEDVPMRVADVWASGFTERIVAYRKQHGLSLPPPAPAVLILPMIDARAAGVAFSADPVSGRRDTVVVSAVPGLGSGLVSGDCNADTFHVNAEGEITERAIVEKPQAHRFDASITEGVSCQPTENPESPAISDDTARQVAELARQCTRHFGRPQDIEWAWDGDQLWLLQSRPITSLAQVPDPDGQLILWDNSNIAESYSGVTTPLTFSFARCVYEEVYREFCRILRVPEADIIRGADTFRCMLGLMRGRVYYNLLNWYRVLAMLPGFDLNRSFMEQMMGVKEPLPDRLVEQVLGEREAVSKTTSYWRLGLTTAALIRAHWKLPETREAFMDRLNAALDLMQATLESMRLDELAAHYRGLERQLITRWDAPLINDFLAMIFFGLLRKLCAKWCGDDNELLANELVMAEGGIISAEPARRIREMARLAKDDSELIGNLESGTQREIESALESCPKIRAQVEDYLDVFGERCLEELKLETLTLADDPMMLYRSIGQLARSWSEQPVNREKSKPDSSSKDKDPAEDRALRTIGGNPLKRSVFRWVLRHTRGRVRDRENLRFERTRIFGRVRRVFLEMGRRLFAEGRLDEPRDVFYLSLDEILGYVEGTAVSWELRPIVTARLAEFAAYREVEPPAGRFETLGAPPIGNSLQGTAKPGVDSTTDASSDRVLQGIGCCPGIVRAKARVILDPRGATVCPGEILIAERTDPGWIMLFASAGGVAVEYGSLLSHSAIVARELGIPGIVSVPGLTHRLQDGDLVELDGAKGTIRKLEQGET